jgi:signal transduction histidine kinase
MPRALSTAADLTLILFAGISFSMAAAPFAESVACRRKLFLVLGTPAVALSCVVAAGREAALISALATTVMYSGAIAFLATRSGRLTAKSLALYAAFALSGVYSVVKVVRGEAEFPVLLALTWMFLLAAILHARIYKRTSPGVITMFAGFAGWALVYGLTAFVPSVTGAFGEVSEFWNVPKYILAFGMVLTLLEDEKITSEHMRERERALNRQLESFAEVTSRLLSGEDVRSLCGHIAEVITTVTTFQRVAILLADEQQKMYLAGTAGVPLDVAVKLEAAVRELTTEMVVKIGDMGRKIGRTSFVFSREQLKPLGAVAGKTDFGGNPFWQTGDEMLVPIRSPKGAVVGFFSLDEPKELTRINSAEMSKLELLADDLGVAIDRAYLERELVRTEKLAGIGQLVAGMAHELNNPLTAVLGHSEIMAETSMDPQVKHGAAIIQRESMRMKKIIENLVRFAKQDKAERRLLSVNQTLDEVIKLGSYQAKSRGVQMQVEVEKGLPRVRFDETQLKQVLLNLFNNAFEAVDGIEQKQISLRAGVNQGIISITVCDSGVGFQDPEKVFDPFFTTKGVGKGPGLGLSVCYGIVKQHGGDIKAFNVQPRGAGVTIEVPVAQQELALTAES